MGLVEALRYAVFVLFAASAGVALGSWAIRTRRLNPFSRSGQFIRRTSDAVLGPIEAWQLKRGGNPQNAPWWLLSGSVVGGIVLITLAEWLAGVLARFGGAVSRGPGGIIRFLLSLVVVLLLIAVFVRVVGSWFGMGRYNRWTRWAYKLTDWIIRPLRQIIPPIGFVDISPFIAWFLLLFLLSAVLSGI